MMRKYLRRMSYRGKGLFGSLVSEVVAALFPGLYRGGTSQRKGVAETVAYLTAPRGVQYLLPPTRPHFSKP